MACKLLISNYSLQDFFSALVMKLQPCICVSGDYVFYDGEYGTKMYFVKKGEAHVIKDTMVVAKFRDTGYFGEVALLMDQPRSADVKAREALTPAIN